VSVSRGESVSIAKIVGTNLARIRNARGLKQADFVQRVKGQGLKWGRNSLSEVENGHQVIDINELAACAEILNVPLSVFFIPDPSFLEAKLEVGGFVVESTRYISNIIDSIHDGVVADALSETLVEARKEGIDPAPIRELLRRVLP